MLTVTGSPIIRRNVVRFLLSGSEEQMNRAVGGWSRWRLERTNPWSRTRRVSQAMCCGRCATNSPPAGRQAAGQLGRRACALLDKATTR